MKSGHSLSTLRDDISSSLSLLTILAENADSDEERDDLLKINRSLLEVATDIDNQMLISENGAITALIKKLGQSASNLDAIHQEAIDLKKTLDIAQKLLDGFGNISKAVTPAGGKKPTGTTPKP